MPAVARWSRDSNLAADHVAAGSFETAMQIMGRTLGLVDFGPLKPLFLSLAAASHAVSPGLPSAPPLLAPLSRPGGLPRICITLPSLIERLKAAYSLVTGGKFVEALEAFVGIIHAATLTVCKDRQQVGELKELINICKEYATAMRLELARKESTDPKRSIELAAYFTHCNLQPAHIMLSLKSAMGVAFKLKLLTSAGAFARRLLELNPRPEFSTQARKVIQLAEQTPGDAFTFDYDERNPFVLCNAELVPIYRGSPFVRSTLSKATYKEKYKGQTCRTDRVGEIGGDAAGLDETAVLSRGNFD